MLVALRRGVRRHPQRSGVSDDAGRGGGATTAGAVAETPNVAAVMTARIFPPGGLRLTYEQFNQFLTNIKRLNDHAQTRDETLAKAQEIFGADNSDLFDSFKSLLSKHGLAEGAAPVCGAASSFRKGTVGGAKREVRRTADGPARRGRSGASASAAHVHARVPLELTRSNGARTAMPFR